LCAKQPRRGALYGFDRSVRQCSHSRQSVTFVSVTQAFNTTPSMGRLTLNILLSFAQFEREVIGEPIRDKFAASRKKGMSMGGYPPLGYEVRDRKLVVNAKESALVRRIFEQFIRIESATVLAKTLREEGVANRRGNRLDKMTLILNNRVYLGKAGHKGVWYPGEHKAIIDQVLWDARIRSFERRHGSALGEPNRRPC
jgi:site-specific DNA recombinase